jgi:pyruvate dehydrogenase E1 component subunit alpha
MAGKGPIVRFEGWLRDNRLIAEDEVRRIEAEVDGEIGTAVAFAEAASLEPIAELERFVTMEQVPE